MNDIFEKTETMKENEHPRFYTAESVMRGHPDKLCDQVSDGILDALSQGIGEEMLTEIIGSSDLKNPGEIANHILNFCIHQCRGHIRDDMTVMVIGIWKKEED